MQERFEEGLKVKFSELIAKWENGWIGTAKQDEYSKINFDDTGMNFTEKREGLLLKTDWKIDSGDTVEKPDTLTTGKIKAYELMKLAADNPGKYEGKRYRVVDGSTLVAGDVNRLYGEFVVNTKDSSALFNSPDKAFGLAIYANTILEEILPEQKLVTFMEAVKAYSEGKTVKCHFEGTDRGEMTYKNKSHLCGAMKDDSDIGISPKEIIDGIWTVED
jgi:hypothetical protein